MSADRPERGAVTEAAEAAGRDRKSVEGRLCFGGLLKRVPVGELLTFLSLNRKTGRLCLTRRDGSGLVILRNGRIIYAASSSVRETFGNILICRGLVSETALAEALERQSWSGENRRLGALLVQMGQLRHEDVEEAVRHQVHCVLSELTQWTDGFFRFDTLAISEGGEIEVDAQDLVVAEGLSTEQILLAIATDEDEREQHGEPVQVLEASEPASAGAGLEDGLPEDLSGILGYRPSPALRGERTLMLLRFASQTLSRGVLFIVRGDRAEGIGHFGLPRSRALDSHPETLCLPLEEPSVVSAVVDRRETYRGPLSPAAGNDRLLTLLGGDKPDEVLAIPVLVDGRVALVLYGDNGSPSQPLGSARPLELALARAGLEIERDSLEGRLRTLEQLGR